jgi:hypothetical protein
MKKVKTSTSGEASLAQSGTRPSDFDADRKWKNGHKNFTSVESSSFIELLNKERVTQERFEVLKDVMKKARNPLNGESTPRDERGEKVINPNAHGKAQGGNMLFDSTLPPAEVSSFHVKKEPMGKIGVQDGKYNILGNTLTKGTPAEPEDLYFLAKKNQMKLVAKKADQDAINASLVKDKLRRYELEMTREVERLKQQLNEKEKTMSLFNATDTKSFM